MEKPAWFVFRKLIKQYKTETIAKEFSTRYSYSFEESLAFVSEIRLKIEEINQPEKPKNNTLQTLEGLDQYISTAYSIHRYLLGNKIIEFSYGTQWLENYIHPLINHLETREDIDEKPYFELFAFQDRVVFRFNNVVKGSWASDESNLVKGKIFMELINVLHNKTDADWLMTVHASAITNGQKTILLSAPPGSGKTTLAALLQANGYQLISDDFVPIDQESFHAYPFPIAMSVKEGSMEVLTSHYPALEKKQLNYITSEKSVRYLPVENKMMNMIFPVQGFIFVKYDNTVDFILEKLDEVRGITLLLEQTWVAPTKGNTAIFLEKVLQNPFFQLTYSNNQKALDAITQLFENE
ncbi:MAG TPA: hypothetical protein VFC65_08360 [Prolixibacteraceae bacterium]|nr:hypothetical protein [Prolixibacteraceae bacterium]